jgi:DNA polymerase Ligase (LigD)
MPRFVILVHDHPFLHWDLLLEDGDHCLTWRLPVDPDISAHDFPAEAIPDHRLIYLDYEGPISGQRGTVTRWDRGTFDWRVKQPDVCEVVLSGQRWQGIVRLKCTDGDHWIGFRLPLLE